MEELLARSQGQRVAHFLLGSNTDGTVPPQLGNRAALPTGQGGRRVVAAICRRAGPTRHAHS